MYKLISSWVFIVIVCLFFVGSLSFAQGPKSRPPGWDKGEKRGWSSDVPPGLEKKGLGGYDSGDEVRGEKGKGKGKDKKQSAGGDEVRGEKDTKQDKRGAVKEKKQKRFWQFWK